MQKLPSHRITALVAMLQSVLALIVWWVYWSLFLFLGPNIDGDKPGHQITIGHRLIEATLFLGLPVVWSTMAAILVWFRAKAAWWLCVLEDMAAVCVGIVFLSSDASRIPDLRKYPGLIPDVVYHIAVLCLPAVALCLLLSRRMRPHVHTLTAKMDTLA
jgi:hypothetical protein